MEEAAGNPKALRSQEKYEFSKEKMHLKPGTDGAYGGLGAARPCYATTLRFNIPVKRDTRPNSAED